MTAAMQGALRYFTRIKNGTTPASGEAEYWDGDVRWATPEDLGKLAGDRISSTKRRVTDKAVEESNLSVIPEGSVLISTRAPIGHMAITNEPMAFNQGCRGLIPGEKVYGPYLYYLLKSRVTELNAMANGTTFVELSRDELADVRISLPSIEMQQRNARFLDEKTARIDALIEKKQALLEELAEKRQALITRAVTKGLNPDVPMKPSGVDWLGDVPSHWSVAALGYRYEVQLGRMLNADRADGEDLKPYLRVLDVQWGKINTSDLPLMDFPPDAQKRYRLATGDLLVNEGGSYVGRSAIWRGEIVECYYQKALHRLRPLDAEDDTTDFLYFVMEAATKNLLFEGGGNQTTIDHLTAEQLRHYRFAFPPLIEQLSICSDLANQLEIHESCVSKVESSLTRLNELRSALITAAVTGQLPELNG